MNKDITAVIAIGGEGTRLKKITGNIPKPLFPIEGISTLKRILNELNKYKIKKILLTTCFKKEFFKEFLEINKFALKEILIFEEKEPLGECGALWNIRDQLTSETLFINGDLIFSMDFEKLFKFHKNTGADITLVTHPSSHPEDSDMISSPNGTYVEKLFHKKRDPKKDPIKPILGYAGISFFKTSIIDELSSPIDEFQPSLFSFFVENAFKESKRIFSYNTSEYIKDMGTEKRYEEVKLAIKKGTLKNKNYCSPQKALFIDRDNTLIKCKPNNYILSINDIEFMEKNILQLANLSTNFSIIAIVTNQPQIAMNKLSLKDLENINNQIIHYCRSKSLLIDTVIWCPHHPHKGYKSELSALKTDCFCRKPKPGMLLELSYQRNINLNSSLFVGDSLVDKQASESAGCDFINIKDL